ncbi:MAG: hypothetical protein ACP5SK_05115 [Thermoprotei archaeon]
MGSTIMSKISSAAVMCPRLNAQVIFVLRSDGSSSVDGCPYYRDGECSLPSARPLGLPTISDRYYVDGEYLCPRCGTPLIATPQGMLVCPRDGSAYLPASFKVRCLFYSEGRSKGPP